MQSRRAMLATHQSLKSLAHPHMVYQVIFPLPKIIASAAPDVWTLMSRVLLRFIGPLQPGVPKRYKMRYSSYPSYKSLFEAVS